MRRPIRRRSARSAFSKCCASLPSITGSVRHDFTSAGLRAVTVNVKLTAQELARIASLTLDHYQQRADDFWEGTRGHDVSQNIAALLEHIDADPPFTILDLGCGPGRDLKT